MDRIKAKNYLNIAHKAGYIIFGSDSLASYFKKLYLVLVDENAGNYSKKIASKIQEKGIPMLIVTDLAELTSTENTKIIGIKNKGLAELIESNLKEL